jgi:Cof subfamily protein (haloacid dehalogenase superfamily)
MLKQVQHERSGRFRVIVMDVDGTIVGPDYVVSERLRRAVRAAQGAGATVSLATGRMMRSAKRFADDSGAAGPVVCYQGALTFVPETGEVLRHERVPAGAAAEALFYFRAEGAHVNLYLDDEVYVERVTPWAEGYASRMEIELRVVPSLIPLADRGPTLVLAVDEKERTEQFAPELSRRLGSRARVTHALAHYCEVGGPGAGKEKALAHLSRLLGVPASQFLAFGDGPGDAAMLGWAGLGVAMSGGHPDALAAAGRTAPGPDEDGVAGVIEDLLAQGRIGE